jgi:predicted dehydrogenase
MPDKIRVAVIGAGKMGISHLAILGAMDQVELVGVAEPSKWISDVIKRYSPFDVYADYRDLLHEKEPQAVVIAVPTRYHAGMAEELIRQGIHLFVEKPLTMHPHQSKSLAQLAVKYRVVNQVGYHNRFLATFQETKKILQEGVIGKPLHFTAEAFGPVVTKKSTQTWRFRSGEGGGCLYDYASHVLDLIHYIISPIRDVQGSVLKSIYSTDVEDAVFAFLHTKDQVSGVLEVNWSDPSYRKMSTSISVQGTEGKITADATEIRLFLQKDNPANMYRKGWQLINHVNLTSSPAFFLRGEEYSHQLEYFIQHVQRGNLNEINHFEQAAATDEIIHTIRHQHQRNHGTNHFWG